MSSKGMSMITPEIPDYLDTLLSDTSSRVGQLQNVLPMAGQWSEGTPTAAGRPGEGSDKSIPPASAAKSAIAPGMAPGAGGKGGGLSSLLGGGGQPPTSAAKGQYLPSLPKEPYLPDSGDTGAGGGTGTPDSGDTGAGGGTGTTNPVGGFAYKPSGYTTPDWVGSGMTSGLSPFTFDPRQGYGFAGQNPRSIAGAAPLQEWASGKVQDLYDTPAMQADILNMLKGSQAMAGVRPTGRGLPGYQAGGGMQTAPTPAPTPQSPTIPTAPTQPGQDAAKRGVTVRVNDPTYVLQEAKAATTSNPNAAAKANIPMQPEDKRNLSDSTPGVAGFEAPALGNSAFDAAKRAFETSIMPNLQNQRSLMGLGRSNAVTKDMAGAWSQMALPLIQDELGREERAIQRSSDALYRNAPIMQQLMSGDQANKANVLNQAMGFGTIGRGISQDVGNAQYEDMLRLQDLGAQGMFAPFGIATSGIGQRTQQGGLFK